MSKRSLDHCVVCNAKLTDNHKCPERTIRNIEAGRKRVGNSDGPSRREPTLGERLGDGFFALNGENQKR